MACTIFDLTEPSEYDLFHRSGFLWNWILWRLMSREDISALEVHFKERRPAAVNHQAVYWTPAGETDPENERRARAEGKDDWTHFSYLRCGRTENTHNLKGPNEQK